MTYTPESVDALVEAVRRCLEKNALRISPLGGENCERCSGVIPNHKEWCPLLPLATALSGLTEEKECCGVSKPFGMTLGTYPNATFLTDCGVTIYQAAWSDTFKFCPYCGKPIKDVTK